MKKSLLLFLTVLVGFTVMAQHFTVKPSIKTERPRTNQKIGFEPTKAHTIGEARKILKSEINKNTDFVNIVTFGSAANGYTYGYSGGQKAIVSANNDLNIVTHFHRMGGTLNPGGYSGDMGYDYSTDGGMTWTAMNECYVATNNAGGTYYTDAARYPNHGIYNPAGNTNPNNAYITYFAPTLDGTNGAGSWGGYAYGRAKIGVLTDTIRTLKPSRPGEGIFQYIPEGYCVTSLGEIWAADFNQDWTSGTMVYKGTMLINHGVWNAADNDFVYTEELIACPTIDGSRPSLVQIAFSPNGMTGYICVIADNGEVPFASGISYFPILWKTTDAGQTWSDPISVSLGGPDGISGVLNYLTDAQIAELFLPPLPARDEIPFTTAFDFDISVDYAGNPHIAVVVGVTGADSYSLSTIYPFTSAMDITSPDGGNTWIAHDCGRPYTFRGLFPDDTYSEDNRIQISRNPSGTKMFVTWIATNLPGYTDNNQPDIFSRGIDVISNKLTVRDSSGVFLDQPVCVTEFTEGMWQAFMASVSDIVLENNGNYTIPMTYLSTGSSNFDPTAPVVFKYIQNFKFNESDFLPGLSVTPYNRNVTAIAGSTTFSVFSDNTWTVSENASWLSMSPTSGNNNGTITATYNANSGSQRIANITVTGAGGTPSVTVTVTQAAPVSPTLTTTLPGNITKTTALSGGNITSDGGTSVTARGVCWNTSGNPTINDFKTFDGAGTGIFTSAITNLDCASSYYVRAYATNNAGTGYGNEVVFETLPCDVNWFSPIWTSPFQPMSIFVTKATIDNLNMVAGDEIGVFDIDPDNGNEICVGSGMLTGELTGGAFIEIVASMDDGTGATNGFMPGNEMIFKLYSPGAGLVDYLTVTFPYPGYDETFAPLGTSFVEVEGISTIVQNIQMSTGWNLVSFRAYPENMNMLTIFDPIIVANQLTKVLDQDGNSIIHLPFPPPNGQWANTIGDLTMEQGYYVKVTESTSLTIEGIPVTMPFEISLRAGWNMISVPCSDAQSAEQTLQTLISSGKLIKVINDAGQSIVHLPFPPPNGQWSYGFTAFVPNEGYYIKVNADCSLVFDCSVSDGAGLNQPLQPSQLDYFQPVYQNNPFMPMTVALSVDPEIEDGDEIGIFDGEVCVGASKSGSMIYVTIPVSMDDPETEILDGFVQGNPITARIWHHNTNVVENADLDFLEGSSTFQPLETYIASIKTILTSINEAQNSDGVAFEINPNPLHGKALMKYSVPSDGQVNIQLLSIDGRLIETLVNEAKPTGEDMTGFNSEGFKPGSYLVKFSYKGSSEKTIIRKLFIY